MTKPANKKPVGSTHKLSDGYIEVKTTEGWMPEHRYIVEMVKGISLDTDQVVHHKNGDKTDNRLDNLEIKDNKEHSLQHSEHREKEIAVIECPECGEEFEREKRQTLLSKPKNKATFCSTTCSRRYYAKGKVMNREKGLKFVKKTYYQ